MVSPAISGTIAADIRNVLRTCGCGVGQANVTIESSRLGATNLQFGAAAVRLLTLGHLEGGGLVARSLTTILRTKEAARCVFGDASFQALECA
jgi:hypothetical protein